MADDTKSLDKYGFVPDEDSSAPEADLSQYGFVPDEDVKPTKKKKDLGKLDAFKKGVEQGSTFGLADEIQGSIGAGTDAVQSLLHNIGLADPSASQVNEKLKNEGFKGDVGPTNFADTYRADRDEAREGYDTAQAQHPYVSFAGNLAGGVGTGMSMGAMGAGKLLAPLESAKDAGLVERIGTGVANSIPSSIVAGTGISKGDLTKGEVGKVADDVVDTMNTGMIIGGGLPIVGEGLKVIKSGLQGLGRLVPDTLKTAFKRGVEGTDLSDPKIGDKIRDNLNETVSEVQAPIAEKQAAQATKDQALSDWFYGKINQVKGSLESGVTQISDDASRTADMEKLELLNKNDALKNKLAAELKVTKDQLNNAIREQMDQTKAEMKGIVDTTKGQLLDEYGAKVQSAEQAQAELQAKLAEKQAQLDTHVETSKAKTQQQLADIQDDVAKGLELEKQKQIAGNASRFEELKKATVEQAKKLQAKVATVKQALGKEYDKIESLSSKVDVKPENRDVIGTLQEEIQQNSFLPENEANALSKKLDTFLGDKSYNGFKLLKQELNRLSQHPNQVVRRAAKNAFKQLHNNYANALDQAGETRLASMIKDTNQRWSAAMDLEDSYIQGTQPDRITGQMLADPTTVRTVGKFATNTPEQLAEAEAVKAKLGVLAPQEAPGLIDETSQIANDFQNAKDFKPSVPSKEEALAQNPEVTRLQQMLQDLKSGNPVDPTSKSLSEEISSVSQQLEQAKSDLANTKASKPSSMQAVKQAREMERYQELLETLKKLRTAKEKGLPDSPEIQALHEKANSLDQELKQAKIDRRSIPSQVESRDQRLANNPEYNQKVAMLDTVKGMKSVPTNPDDIQNIKSIIKSTLGDDAVAEFEKMVAQNMAPEDSLVSSLPRGKQNLKDMLTKLLPKYGQNGADDVSANKLDQLVKTLSDEKGANYGKDLSKRLKDLADDIHIRDNADQGKFKTTYLANQAGKISAPVVKPITTTKEFMSKGVKYLSDMGSTDVGALVNKMRGMGPEAEQYAKILESTVDKNSTSRNAIIFSLMQQPGFRETMHKLLDTSEKDNGK